MPGTANSSRHASASISHALANSTACLSFAAVSFPSARARHSSWRVRLAVSLRAALRVLIRNAFTIISPFVGRARLPPLTDQRHDPLGTSHLAPGGARRPRYGHSNKPTPTTRDRDQSMRRNQSQVLTRDETTQTLPETGNPGTRARTPPGLASRCPRPLCGHPKCIVMPAREVFSIVVPGMNPCGFGYFIGYAFLKRLWARFRFIQG